MTQQQHGPEVEYTYVDGLEAAVKFGLDPQTAGEELDRIKHRDGTIAPGVVVDEARPEEAPLHPAFEWRDPVAAEQYRVIQAKTLIRQVRVICPEPVENQPVVAASVSRTEPIEPTIQQFDPLAHDLSKTVGSLTETRRMLTELKMKAARRFDRKKVIAADVALAELREAEENLDSAHAALTDGKAKANWQAGGR